MKYGSDQKNTITPHIQKVHNALAKANFTSSSIDASARCDLQRVQRLIDTGKSGALMTMAALPGCNIYEKNPKAVTYGGAMIKGKQTLQLIDQSNSSSQSNSIVDAYEEIDVFVKNISAEYFFAKRGQVPINNKDRQLMQRKFGNNAAEKNTPQYFHQISETIASRNCDPIFKLLFKHVKDLKTRVQDGHFGDYHEIHKAVEFIRHSKTHSNGRF